MCLDKTIIPLGDEKNFDGSEMKLTKQEKRCACVDWWLHGRPHERRETGVPYRDKEDNESRRRAYYTQNDTQAEIPNMTMVSTVPFL